MYFLGIFVLMLSELSLGFPVPVDTIIVQVRQWGVVGAQRVVNQVLLNGVSLTGTSQEVDNIIQSMLAGGHLPALTDVNQTSALRNHTVLRSRECILEGSQLHWTDRVFYDGKVYLTLDDADTWTAHVPQALALKELWDREVQRTGTDKIRFQDECNKLMIELRLSEDRSDPETPWPQFLIPVLALLVFIGLIIVSLLLSNRSGLLHPGGVIGSVIHYPKDMSEMALEVKNSSYCAL
uniref:uncharacterized protein LOC124069916 n=1 Tax=Scatophagus argus TaxID=75038 RepID=UPI001ED8487C|nr:uncharacterized protein LOC124069916 [Scatophagus argus]